MVRRASSLLAPLAVLGLLLAGCGGDDDSADDTDATTEQTEAEGSSDGAAEADEAADAAEETVASDVPAAPAEFCTAFGDLLEVSSQQDETTLEGLRASATVYVEGLAEVAPLAPEEVADDIAAMLEGAEELQAIAAAATSIEQAEEEAAGIRGDASLVEAGSVVVQYHAAACADAEDE